MQNGTAKHHQLHERRNGEPNRATHNRAGNDGDGLPVRVYKVRMSKRFVVLSLLSCTLLAFAVGRTARMVLIVNPQRRVLEVKSALQQLEPEQPVEAKLREVGNRRDVMDLPNPVLKNRPVPKTLYSAMNYDTARSASITSRFVVSTYDDQSDENRPDGASCPADSATAAATTAAPAGTHPNADESTNHGDDEVHLPAGQHLLMDIRNVQSAFLASEERLALAMLDVVGSCGLTLLSYHCHGLQPSGVSCVGVLLESHVSFHTWPSQGVITLDLFTCGSQSLLPIVSKVERLFGIPATSDGPETVWAYKVRGFSEETPEELTDLFTFPIGFMSEYKTELVSTYTNNNQRIDVYDVIRPVYQTYQAYKKSLQDNESYEAQHRDFFRPDRLLFLDGILQARRSEEVPYHEALVHPAMFAHKDPRRVLLLNCSGGAALREVLKHNTVKTVVMVEDDEAAVRISRRMFPEFHDCSAFLGESGDRICFEDPRVEIVYSNLYEWVSSREGVASTMTGFDVIVLDDIFYVDSPAEYSDFISFLSEKTTDDTVLVAQVGESPRLDDPANELSGRKYLPKFIHSLLKHGFVSVVDYEEAHVGFSTPWQFVVAFQAFSHGRRSWFRESSQLELVMNKRTLPTRDGNSSLLHFDSAVMEGYKHPSRASEIVFCRGNPENFYCRNEHGFDPERPNYDRALEVAPSTLGKNAGRGVFAKVDIPVYSYVDLSQVVHPVYMSPSTHEIAGKSYYALGDYFWGNIVGLYAWSYGLSFSHHGDVEIVVDTNLLCFLNHGCDGRSNLSYKMNVTEESADPEVVPEEILEHQFRLNDEYNPAAERYPEVLKRASPIRDILRGEELFINYLALTGNKWFEDVVSLRKQCRGGVGDVLEYELWIDQAYGDGVYDDEYYDVESDDTYTEAVMQNEPVGPWSVGFPPY